VFARIGVEPLDLVREDGTHHPRRERALEQAVSA
jgi:hypothetical protein